MALEVFNGTSIPREFTTAPMEYLWAKWRVLASTHALTLQRLTEESSYALRPNLTYLMSLQDDFVYVYVGEAIQREAGENLSGTLLSHSPGALRAELAKACRKATETQKPVFVRFTNANSQSGTIWQRLILPVPLSDGPVMLVIYSELVSHQLEIYEHLFRTASEAMLIACPIANDVGHTTDGWVIMMNDRAREFLRFDGSIGNLRLSDLPQFHDIEIWGRLYARKDAQAMAPLVTAEFELEIMRFPGAFGLKILRRTEASRSSAPSMAPGAVIAPAQATRA